MDFQPLGLFLDSFLGGEQGRNCDECTQLGRYSLLQLEAGQRARPQQIGHRTVDQCDSQIRGRNCGKQAEQHEITGVQSHLAGVE